MVMLTSPCFSELGRKNFIRLIRRELQGSLFTPTDEEAILKVLSREMASLVMPPISGVELFLADGCNLNCTYCFEGLKPKRFLSFEVGKLTVDRLVTEWARESERIHVVLFGGEPLLNWRVLKEIVQYAEFITESHNKNVTFHLTTNGTLLNKDRLHFLATHKVGVMISIDGIPEVHDRYRRTRKGGPSFPLAWRGFQLLREHFGAFEVRMTIMPDTAPMLSESIQFLIENGVRRIISVPAMGTYWSEQDWDVYQEQFKKVVQHFRATADNQDRCGASGISFLQEVERMTLLTKQTQPPNGGKEGMKEARTSFGCYAGIGSVAVTASGDILPCSAFAGCDELRKTYTLGNVKEGWLNDFRRRELLVLNRQRGLKCAQCALKTFCSAGGCMVNNYYATGYLVEPDPLTCRTIALSSSLARTEMTLDACPSHLLAPSSGDLS